MEFTQALRAQVIVTADAIRTMLAEDRLPRPVNDARCRECSVKEICQPEALGEKRRLESLAARLYEIGESEVDGVSP